MPLLPCPCRLLKGITTNLVLSCHHTDLSMVTSWSPAKEQDTNQGNSKEKLTFSMADAMQQARVWGLEDEEASVVVWNPCTTCLTPTRQDFVFPWRDFSSPPSHFNMQSLFSFWAEKPLLTSVRIKGSFQKMEYAYMVLFWAYSYLEEGE